jgi:nucleoside-diphosphate-sugar epimerase
MIKKKRIIVSGYNGYIGRNLISFFKKKKIEFKKFDIDKLKNYHFNNFTHFIHLNFYIKEEKKNILKNYKEIKKVIKICKDNKLFLIFPSTACFKYRGYKRLSNNINVINYYTFAKNECEKKIFQSGLRYCVLRIFNVYGGDTKNRYYISFIINQFLKKKTLNIKFKNNYRDYIHINDLCNLICKVITKNKTGVYEAGSGQSISIQKLVILIKDTYFKRININFIRPYKSVKNSYSSSKIKRTEQIFNWKPKIFLKKGLENLIIKTKNNVNKY